MEHVSKSLQNLYQSLGHSSLLDDLSPEEFTREVAETLPVLAGEFDTVTLRISGSNVAQFCQDLRRGMMERAVHEGLAKEIDELSLRAAIDPSSFEFPRRIEITAMFHKSVELNLTPDQARLLALDLGCGILCRPAETGQMPSP